MLKNRILYYLIIFLTGAIIYAAIETAYRGSTHPSMLLAGGAAMVFMSGINVHMRSTPLLYRCIIGSIIITLIELAIGAICNLWLGLGIWDYTHFPFNILGQICLLFSVIWAIFSAVALKTESLIYRLYKKSVRD